MLIISSYIKVENRFYKLGQEISRALPFLYILLEEVKAKTIRRVNVPRETTIVQLDITFLISLNSSCLKPPSDSFRGISPATLYTWSRKYCRQAKFKLPE